MTHDFNGVSLLQLPPYCRESSRRPRSCPGGRRDAAGWTGGPSARRRLPHQGQGSGTGTHSPVLPQMRALVKWAPVPHPARWRAAHELPLLCSSLEGAGLACQPRGRRDGPGSPAGQVDCACSRRNAGETDRQTGGQALGEAVHHPEGRCQPKDTVRLCNVASLSHSLLLP